MNCHAIPRDLATRSFGRASYTAIHFLFLFFHAHSKCRSHSFSAMKVLFTVEIFDHQRTYKFGVDPKEASQTGRTFFKLIDEEDESLFDELCVFFQPSVVGSEHIPCICAPCVVKGVYCPHVYMYIDTYSTVDCAKKGPEILTFLLPSPFPFPQTGTFATGWHKTKRK